MNTNENNFNRQRLRWFRGDIIIKGEGKVLTNNKRYYKHPPKCNSLKIL